jgi:hypothetical protein
MLIEVFSMRLDIPTTAEQLRWRLRNPILVRLIIPTVRVLCATWLVQIFYWLRNEPGEETEEDPKSDEV